MATEIQSIVDKGKLVSDPSQKEYAATLVTEFLNLHENFSGPQPVKLLFSIDESDTFNVSDVVHAMPKDGQPATAVPQPLLTEFVKAGAPLPQEYQVYRDGALPGIQEWEISTILPGDEENAYTGTGLTVAVDNTLTLAAFDGTAPKDGQVNGYTVQVTSGSRKGLAGTIKSYTASTKAATMGDDWAPLPTKGSEYTITQLAITGTGVASNGNNPPTLTLTGAKLTPGLLKGLTLQVTDSNGNTGSGTISDNTDNAVTMDADWAATGVTLDDKAKFTATLPDISGTVSAFAMASPTSITVTAPTGVTLSADALKGGTLTITGGPGKGVRGKITASTTAGVLTMDTDWTPLPGPSDKFEIAKETTYTIRLVPDDPNVLSDDPLRLDVYVESSDPELLVQWRIAQLDDMISRQLSLIMHNEAFQKLEASWRGLHDLVFNTETGTNLKLRLLNATRQELQNDLDNAVEFDQSVLFKKVYEEEYGMFGGSPYSALLADFAFGRLPQDVNFLEGLSNVAAAAHAPLITNAAPELFDLPSFAQLQKPRDLAKIFESAEMIKWNSFRDSEDSRYVALVLPRVMARLPYGPDTLPVAEFNFVEQITDQDGFLWGNAAWAMAQRITESFFLYSWTAAIRGYEGGGLVSDLPIYTYKTDDGEVAVEVPTEVAITDRREKELSDLGFIALCYRKGTDEATFFGGQTANRPKVYIQDAATANARLSASLPYMLAASRFAHYIKVIMRDKIGSFMTRDNVSALLNSWITQYVLLNDEAGQETKARYPLREGRIDVTDDPARPGYYNAVVFLRPHFQLEELTVSIRLVAALPAPAGQ